MDSDLSPAERTVLNTLIAQTNEFQDDWTGRRSLYVGVVAHGSLSPDEAEAAIAELLDKDYIQFDGGEYRVADDVERIPHPGEIQRQE